ncbi:MAG TPA: hypothetical protein VJ783_08025 [Pirellulales bacterium]|nr:hypothetical protein [Pirellulales bacterium]
MTQRRAEIIAALSELCERYPHWRLGQLVANVADWADRGVWDVEDEQLLEAAQRHLEHLSQRDAELATPHRPGG